MIYTIGLASIYEPYIDNDPNPCKASKKMNKLLHGRDEGGSVWQSYEEAEVFANASSKNGQLYKVYGVIGVDWTTDTAPVGNATYHELLKEGKLVRL